MEGSFACLAMLSVSVVDQTLILNGYLKFCIASVLGCGLIAI